MTLILHHVSAAAEVEGVAELICGINPVFGQLGTVV